ncbi:hypothetical protein Fmac_002623 [Flemingia macrophylla]|uniref:Plant heme peroxidase family profile domain-containing protein n=1 Tax=Flemingia macrophylla TaxID=520843 RepID=A0ABD1NL87_9FABA
MAGVDDDYVKEIEKARRELRFLITLKKCAPLIRLIAWAEVCTYDVQTRTGGANGSIKLIPTKTGAEPAFQICGEDVKAKFKKVSYADLYQLAGIVAIEVTGGPTIPFVPGRQDSNEDPPAERLLTGLLINHADAQDLRNFFCRMGLSEDKDIVALCGGLRALLPPNDLPGQMAKDPLKFDNSYFVKLLRNNVSPRLPIDDALVKDEEFRHYVELYEKDEDTFFKDYAIVHEKLSELGCNLKKLNQPKPPQELFEKLNQPKPPKGLFEKLNQPRELIGIGLVSVVVTVILGYLIKKPFGE